jgi:tetratricopeptide (TPR) repeat protein
MQHPNDAMSFGPGSAEGLGEEGLEALASVYERTGRHREAAACLQQLSAIVNDPIRRALVYRQLAGIWRRLGAVAAAQECLEWVLSFDRGCEAAYEELTALYLSERRWRAAIDVFLRHARIALRDTRARIYAELARLYEHELHDLQRAMDCYQLLENDLDDPTPALRDLARLAAQREQFDEAVRALTSLAEHSSGDEEIEALVHAGTLAMDCLGDGRAAEALFGRALDADPRNLAARLGVAAALCERNDVEAAVSLLRRGITQAPAADRPKLLAAVAELEPDLDLSDGGAAEARKGPKVGLLVSVRERLVRLFAPS